MKDSGFFDCAAMLSDNPDTLHTWRWRLKNDIEIPARIDYVFCNDALMPKVMKIEKETGSDHFFVTVEMEFKKSLKREENKK
ncbi:MAG TPA: hypothetical protein DET40_07430 [Lentisphaeria bacterium]|nr:MAG: hypothetical protein A2X45_06870 [Lentisphaerae bacterium GWF2_50_93]HCE43363.1 hypothetical protein [Lentisphaeria bacterium]